MLVHGGLELAPAHRLQQGRVVGQLESPHGRVEGFPHLRRPGRYSGPIAWAAP